MAGWTQLVAAAPWNPRWRPGFLYFKGNFWIFGGYSDALFLMKDVWYSPDCINWTQVADAPWNNRDEFGYLVYDDKMWVVCGYVNNRDIWSTTDGVNWVREAVSTPMFGRSSFVLFDYKTNDNTYRFVIAGGNSAGAEVESYGSNDMATWTLISNANPWRKSFIGEYGGVLNGSAYLVGGSSTVDSFQDNVWSSSDGINWTNIIAEGSAPFTERNSHFVTDFNNRLWMFGGNGVGNVVNNETWTSVNGIDWTENSLNYAANYTPRMGHRCIEVNGRIYLIGGADNVVAGTFFNDVWVLDDTIIRDVFTANGTPNSSDITGDAPFDVVFRSEVGEGTWEITNDDGEVIYLVVAVFFNFNFGFPGNYQVRFTPSGPPANYTMGVTVTRFRIIATPTSGQAPLNVRFGF